MAVRKLPRMVGCASLALAALFVCSPPAHAETRVEREAAAAQLVAEALHREVYGQGEDRAQLLNEAIEKSPNLAVAHWHLGRVKEGAKWVAFEETAAAAQTDKRLIEYRHRRDHAEETIVDQFALADWCRAHDLIEQEQAHLWRVVELSPNLADARRRLGHIQVNGEWLTVEQRREEFERLVESRQAMTKWLPEMREIAHQLNRRNRRQREAAAAKLQTIHDPAAIGAMEEAICPLGEEAGQLVVEVIASMDEHEAALALARHAVYSPHGAVRELACEKLKARDHVDFVPALLAELQTPVMTRNQVFRGRGGSLVCRQVMAREGQDHRDLAVLETEYQRIARVGGDRDETLARALADLQRTAMMRDAAISRENTQTAVMNLRVMQVLEAATGEIHPPTPQDWWTWWNDENEVFVETDKPLRQRYQREQIALVDRTGDTTGPNEPTRPTTDGPPTITGPPPGMYDCLAAGTKVWTDLGPQSIEEIQVGDRVLAQDPETGELAYKPVLGTTIRPASQLVRIEAGQDAITTSGGHLYWTSGDGWQKARDVSSGAELHSVRGSVRISAVSEAEFAPTYNLIVADFHTYFVGASLVLCHDNTVSEPTNAIVPGLKY